LGLLKFSEDKPSVSLSLLFSKGGNMKTMILKAGIFMITAALFTSCVTMKKYQEMEAARVKCDQENAVLKKDNIDLTTLNNELQAKISKLTDQARQLAADTLRTGKEFRLLADKFDRLSKSYDELNEMFMSKSKTSSAELQKLLAELQKAQEELQTKEDLLNQTANDLNLQKKHLDDMSAQLADKEQRLNELQSILDKKDSVVRALKAKVSEALTGFINKGLTVEQKNGKVYVRMDEKLLFATGSSEVAASGVDALKKLGKVLETNPDVNITIEGHTDDVPYVGGSGPVNTNWDLSVMRATAVVKILLKNSTIAPKRLMAAGRSEYWPVDAAKTAEARSKNRRTEIILTPKLDELFKILE
jgi:chemotaxis protein MotB